VELNLKIEYKTEKMNPIDYHELRISVGWSSYDLKEIEKGLRNTLFNIVGYFEEKAIAMGRVIGDGKMVFYIQDVIVLPEYQGNGIGRNIMNLILGYIESNTVNNSIIGLMSATGKESFYESFGFIKRPNERMGCGMNIWVKK